MDSDSDSENQATLANLMKKTEVTGSALSSQRVSLTSSSPTSDSESSSIKTTGIRAPQDGLKPNHVVVVNDDLSHSVMDYPPADGYDYASKVLADLSTDDKSIYNVRYGDNFTGPVELIQLLALRNGPEALERFEGGEDSNESPTDSESDIMSARGKRQPRAKRGHARVNYANLGPDDDSDDPLANPASHSGNESQASIVDEDSDDDKFLSDRRSTRTARPNLRAEPVSRRSRRFEEIIDSSSGSEDILVSDILPRPRKRRRGAANNRAVHEVDEISSDDGKQYRRSERNNRPRKSMREIGENKIERSSSSSKSPRPIQVAKPSGAREVFKPLPRGNPFRERHMQYCDTCGHAHNAAGSLIYCQGCTLAYHKSCLGTRGSREHIVTKINEEDFVLQCRRCINTAKRKDSTAPDMSKCQDCHEKNPSCTAFRHKKTPLQEQREREENEGDDPITAVAGSLINNIHSLLFRCVSCARGWHLQHLPPKDRYAMELGDDQERADARSHEYSRDFKCLDCSEMPDKVSSLVAWRPVDPETYNPDIPVELIEEDEKEYLIKWNNLSYFRAEWKSGAWTWGVTAVGTRRSFFKKETGPRMTTQDAIPEEFLRIDIVLDVKYSSRIDIRTDEIDKARIKEVDTALLKYKGLGYEDAVWERVPKDQDGDRWTDFVTAYNEWVLGRYIHLPKGKPLSIRLEKLRDTPFDKLERKKQPEALTGGELMKYQLDGTNWLYYQWYLKKNGILADEMGLGKTIQITAFLTTMITENNCFPFLIVVPNSTCPNWRREIKHWAPQLRVVTYYGSQVSRDLAYKYEMFPEGTTSVRCHIVVTSYEAAADDNCRRFFKSVPWQGLIVDEGQRLKSDKTILHNVLKSLKVPFRLLLTGTPLQNNARELFNLLQFLDDTISADALEEEYAEMTNENIGRLHELIRPYILRRTKAQVLTFLPPLAQIIVPVSMTSLQQKLYRSILAKNPELLRAILSSGQLKQGERASLNNILMQLRKVLCHPFIYSQEIEEKSLSAPLVHRNFVEASAKFEFLELLLPKLHERGHRVLIFSQFLDMLTMAEDFLDGLQLRYQRLDGNVKSLDKQKRIDEFNAPDSPLFAFLLSTRAGGVGINLATADTVIILDPDFNPHQDLQAISRAHRIGQKKKVLCFQVMTRNSAEEKIMQVGRKKMALDHVVVEQMDAEDLEEKDVAGILRHGASALFSDDAQETIKFDDASIDRLIDRSQIENTKVGDDASAESQFSFARVWANDQSGLQEQLDVAEETAPDPGLWNKILKQRERAAAEEAAIKAEMFGRGRRAKQAVTYTSQDDHVGRPDASDPAAASSVLGDAPVGPQTAKPAGVSKKPVKGRKLQEESDTDFLNESTDSDDDEDDEPAVEFTIQHELQPPSPRTATGAARVLPPNGQPKPFSIQTTKAQPAMNQPIALPPVRTVQPSPASTGVIDLSQEDDNEITTRSVPNTLYGSTLTRANGRSGKIKAKEGRQNAPKFKRVTVEPPQMTPNPLDRRELMPNGNHYPPIRNCAACGKPHLVGSCPLKIAGVERCNLCGGAHYGMGRNCPHIKSETQVKLMLDALRMSNEPQHIVAEARRYLKGVKGTLVQHKKQQREKAAKALVAQGGGAQQRATGGTNFPSAHDRGLAEVEHDLYAALGARDA